MKFELEIMSLMSLELSNLEELRERAEQGDSCAKFEIGEIYYRLLSSGLKKLLMIIKRNFRR